LREEVVSEIDVAVDEHVLPGDEGVVQDEHGVVLVEAAGERVVERGAHHGGGVLVRCA
jgi:hypothetical protein